MKQQHSIARVNLLMGVILMLIIVGVALELSWPPLLTQAQGTLPPREPPRATPTPKKKDKSDNKPVGAYIELQLQPAPTGGWTVVQWQDSDGGWHDVTGWQGTLEGQGRRWWVAAKDFGTGPFRWVIYRAQNGARLAISEVFDLPQQPNETVLIQVTLSP